MFALSPLATHTTEFIWEPRGSISHTHAHKHTLVYTNPWIAADACEQRVQDGIIVVVMQQDETQEGFEEGSLCHTAQEKVQVGGAGDHLIHRRLQTQKSLFQNCKGG